MTLDELAKAGGRIQMNGDILFPTRGKPPIVPKGYYADSHTPFVLHPEMPECADRTFQIISTRCCRENKVFTCQIDGQITNYIRCSDCKGRKGAGRIDDLNNTVGEATIGRTFTESDGDNSDEDIIK